MAHMVNAYAYEKTPYGVSKRKEKRSYHELCFGEQKTGRRGKGKTFAFLLSE